ncbi:MAG TPA: hypothetical protein VL463_09735 [Kofleriaceae bacterium]|jgi:hypothetical protein|nr:hypothetical protein [Kofleriaceae bacterium]
MIIGAHSIIYSKDSDADRAFLKDVLGFPHVDVGHGWLIFGLPPAEVAVHPGEANDVHELYLMTDDVEALVRSMKDRGVESSPITSQGWGMLTSVTLPGGGKLGIYQPRHASPPQHSPKQKAKKAASKAKQKTAPKKKQPARKPAKKQTKKR